MNQNEIKNEILKCQKSPYYFATNYLTVKNDKGDIFSFTTPLNKNDFNKMVKQWEINKIE